MQPRFLAEKIEIVGADVEPARRPFELRDHDIEPIEATIDGGCGFYIVLDAFQPHPEAREARQGIAVKAVIQNFLHAGRIENRDHGVDHVEFGLVCIGRGFGGMVVTHQREHPAMAPRAGQICVTEDIAGSVDPRPLAVPEREGAVIARQRIKPGLLRAPAGGGRKFLVEARLEDDVVRLKPCARLEKLLIKTAQRRTAISGHEAGRIQPGTSIQLVLHHHQPKNGLRTRHEHPVFRQVVLVGQAHVMQRHANSLPDAGTGCLLPRPTASISSDTSVQRKRPAVNRSSGPTVGHPCAAARTSDQSWSEGGTKV